jgi:hypothetical protein
MGNLENVLSKISNGEGGSAELENHFDAISGAVPQEQLAQGIASAFHSEQTPAFPQMLASLFQNSNPDQKAGMLNQLLGMAGPGALSQVLGQTGLSGLLGGGQVTPQQAQQVDPQAVSTIASEAHKQDPNIVDAISGFYAQHPTLVKGLGAAALGILLSKMSHH